MSWIVSEINIQGVKGVLDQCGDFKLSTKKKPKSIVVFAPNGCGKSGYADAVEYLFSEDGMVEHLGKGGADSERGGKHALPHVLADVKGITPQVSISLINPSTGEIVNAVRQVKTGRTDSRPSELENIIRLAPAHRVLRQHDLRRFVVEMSPGDKYSELSRWIGLTKLEQVLKHLVTTANLLQNTNLDREMVEREKDIKANTNYEIENFNLPLVFLWCANQAKPFLKSIPTIQNTDDLINLAIELREVRDTLIFTSSASEVYEAKKTLEIDLQGFFGNDGPLANFVRAYNDAVAATKTYLAAQESAKNSLFREVWTVSKELLNKQPIETCPICKTEWSKTEMGSQSAAVVWLQSSLQDLKELEIAGDRQQATFHTYEAALVSLIAVLSSIVGNLTKLNATNLITEVETALSELKSAQAHTGLSTDLEKVVHELPKRISLYFSETLITEVSKLEVKGLPEEITKIDHLVKKSRTYRSR